LVLARDRAGEKPLFWRRLHDEIWFASEIQALFTTTPRTIDSTALVDYVHFGYVREPRTIVSGIHRVCAGTTMVFDRPEARVHRYWDPASAPVEELDIDGATTALEERLVVAVERQLVADVPVGVFTSGGVDSSLLAVLAARALAPHRLQTFAVGFADRRFDERHPAADLARICGSEHSEVVADEHALRQAFDRAAECIAEPIGDPALLPTILLADHAKRRVGVVLSGEGADELFGGYPTYLGHRLAPAFLGLPRLVRKAIGGLVGRLPASHGKVTWDYLVRRFVHAADAPLLPRHVAWFGTGLSPSILAAERLNIPLLEDVGSGDVLSRAMLFDYRTYLPDGLLTKIDRASMLVGLEARAPYLDREVTGLAFGLPVSLKVRGLETKWLLKRVAQRHLPDGLVLRRKRGLSVPIAAWINGGLRGEVDRLLQPERLEAGGLFNADGVGALLRAHRAGRANHARGLWPLIVFERWRERWMGDA
jgi:asparagine synthase (glutamine-hydrolysing)